MDVFLFGPVPTPAVAMLTRSMRADLGVMISASHNPFADNGIKIFGPDGFKLSDEQELEIEAMLDDPSLMTAASPETIGRAKRIEDAQARYIEATVPDGNSVVRVASIYLPNGNPVGTEKYTYKLAWMDRLISHTRDLLCLEEPLVLAGDYNVIPSARDCHDPAAWANDALFLPQTREKFRTLLNLGLTDALRTVRDDAGLYTFWDYQAGAWQRNNGIRIDHLLLSPQAADRLKSVEIDKDMRAREKPSDHVPIRIELA
jgi:exodeoxyribonuclease-3